MKNETLKEKALKWAEHEIFLLKAWANGDGLYAIQARKKLKYLKTLTQEQFNKIATKEFKKQLKEG